MGLARHGDRPYRTVEFKIPEPTCAVRGCDEESATREPIYAAQVDRPFASENIVVCDAVLCWKHAGLLSWSI